MRPLPCNFYKPREGKLDSFSSQYLWPNAGSMLLSNEPLKHALYAILVTLLASAT